MKKGQWHTVPHHPEILVGQYVVPNFVSNSVLVQVSENDAIVVSPGKVLLDNCPFKERNNDIHLHIIMPNGYHYMGVSAWQAAYPNHTLYASKMAITMLKQKLETRDQIQPLEEFSPPLPEHYSIVFPPGHRAGDVWLVKENESGDTWITCDSVLNYDRLSNQPIARFLQKLLDAAPGLKISKVIKFFILSDRRSFKSWALKRLQQRTVTTLIPSHGEIKQSSALNEELKSLLTQAL